MFKIEAELFGKTILLRIGRLRRRDRTTKGYSCKIRRVWDWSHPFAVTGFLIFGEKEKR